MKIPSDELKKIVRDVAPFSRTKSPNHAYQCIHLLGDKGGVTAICQDGEATATSVYHNKNTHPGGTGDNVSPDSWQRPEVASDTLSPIEYQQVKHEYEFEACVEVSKLSPLISLVKEDQVDLRVDGNKLKIKTGKRETSLPNYEYKVSLPDSGYSYGDVVLNGDDMKRCFTQTAVAADNEQATFSPAHRLYFEGGSLYFCTSTGSMYSCAYCPASGEDIDLKISKSIAAKACKFFGPNDDVGMTDFENLVTLSTEDKWIDALKPSNSGKTPEKLETIMALSEAGSKWLVSRGGMLEFLKEAKIFVTLESFGVLFRCKGTSIECEFNGNEQCFHEIDGEGPEGDFHVLHRKLFPIASVIEDEKVEVRVLDRGVFFLGDKFLAGIGQAARKP